MADGFISLFNHKGSILTLKIICVLTNFLILLDTLLFNAFLNYGYVEGNLDFA